MEITSAKFIKGISGTGKILYDGRFQIAFLGRSNVGKSTLINSLVKRNSLARTSSSPGKTIRMDFFLINDDFYFVDFPGYGYARRSAKKREKLAKMILWYIMYSGVTRRLAVLVTDAQVGLTPYDLDIMKTLNEHRVNFLVIANKIDKLKKPVRDITENYTPDGFGNGRTIPFSSKNKTGRVKLLQAISRHI